jgi:drug/metabolite transporter (DMT)-like permease
MPIRLKAEFALLGITFIWGTSFSITKDAIAHIDSLEFLALRFIVATAILIVLFWRDLRVCRRKDVLAGAWIGVILWIAFTFQVKGLEYTTPSKSAFVTGFSVILVPLFESALDRKRPSLLNILCGASALVGLYLLSGTRSLFPLDYGIFLTLLCAIGFAWHVIVVGHFVRARNTNVLVFTQIAVTAFAATAAALRHGIPSIQLSARILVAIFVTAVLATALAFFVQNWAQKFTLPSRTALILSTEPVFAAIVSYLTIHERWTGRMFLGCLLIFLGIIASELQNKEKLSLDSIT